MSEYKIYTKLVTKALVDPITLSEAKNYLRITNDKEDLLITSLIKATRNIAEDYLKISLTTQIWQARISGFISGYINLPKGPIQKIDWIHAIKRGTDQSILSAAIYEYDHTIDRLVFKLPIINNGLIINYTTGYSKVANIPDAIKLGLLTHIASIYDDRSNSLLMNKAVFELYKPYRKISI